MFPYRDVWRKTENKNCDWFFRISRISSLYQQNSNISSGSSNSVKFCWTFAPIEIDMDA